MVTSMKKMTETIYDMVTSSKNKEKNTIYMMSSVTGIIWTTAVTNKNLETMIDMVVGSREKNSKYRIEQHLTRKENVNVMYFLITAKR